MEKIGLQLYSIKELMKEDFLGTLEKIAKIGYDGVEFAGYFDTPAKTLKSALKDLGLLAAGSHISISKLQEELDKVIEYSLEINDPFIICPGLPVNLRDSADTCKRTAELFNKIGQKCKDHGILFGYHNHNFEFQKFDGEFMLDIFAANTQPDLMFIELDTFWVEYTGLQSVDFINKYKERCAILHIKDMKSPEDKRNTIISKGIMDFKNITTQGKKYNVKWYTVEQEEFEESLLYSVDEGYRYLRSIL